MATPRFTPEPSRRQYASACLAAEKPFLADQTKYTWQQRQGPVCWSVVRPR